MDKTREVIVVGAGAQGIHVPRINTARDAQAVVNAA